MLVRSAHRDIGIGRRSRSPCRRGAQPGHAGLRWRRSSGPRPTVPGGLPGAAGDTERRHGGDSSPTRSPCSHGTLADDLPFRVTRRPFVGARANCSQQHSIALRRLAARPLRPATCADAWPVGHLQPVLRGSHAGAYGSPKVHSPPDSKDSATCALGPGAVAPARCQAGACQRRLGVTRPVPAVGAGV
jgi:hypothetical protein